MTFQPDQSGINSLAGFAYQIKVFAYYMFDLKENMMIEFESIEDVNLKTIKEFQIDDNSYKFICKTNTNGTNKAIQVKHTSISNAVAQQMLFNWILLEQSSYSVEKYILFTEKFYQNDDDIFSKDAVSLYNDVVKSDKNASATISKVKRLFEADFDSFKIIYDNLKNKFEFIDLDNIDFEIEQKASIHFRKAANIVVFGQRMQEFLQHITIMIMNAVGEKKPYILTYQEFMSLVEDISTRFTSEITLPCYSEFKKINKIDLKESKIANSREFLQLQFCNLPEYLIKKNLLYGMYYNETALKYMENNKLQKVEDIEETTFENFEDVKFDLKRKCTDTPYDRLRGTKEQPNSFTENEQIKYGSAICLTKEGIGKHQISWKDEDNA